MFKQIVFVILTIFIISQTGLANNCRVEDYQEENTVAGTWTGKLDAGGTVLRIVFNISQNDGGEYTATLDSPDQGAKGIPIEDVIYVGNQLTFSVPSVEGKYEGTVNEDSLTMKGTWSQRGSSFALDMEKGELEPVITESEVMDEKDFKRLYGKWLGTLKIESAGLSLRLVFNLSVTPENTLQATLDSPDQGAEGIPVTRVEFSNNHVKFEVKSVAGNFEGDMSDDNLSIEGSWIQGGVTRQLSLKKVEE